MFDFMESLLPKSDDQILKICNDEKINKLVNSISAEMDKVLPWFPKVKNKKAEYSTWDHVGNLGMRLWYSYTLNCEYLCDPEKWCGIGRAKIEELVPTDKLSKIADSYGLVLSVIQTPTFITFTTIEKKHNKKSKEIEED